MENAYFLISDLQVEDGSHKLLHSLTCAQVNAKVFVFVKDFERLKPLRDEFPSAIFLLLDLTKNVDIIKGCLRLIPRMDCVLNFSGESYAMITRQGEFAKVSWECEINCCSISLEGIAGELEKNEDPGGVLINITAEASNTGSGGCSIFSGGNGQDPPYSPPGPPVKFRVRSNFPKLPTASVPPTERQPLLSSTSPSQDDPEPGFLSCLFCFCYPYCSASETGPTKFDSPDELMNYIRLQQTEEIKEGLEKLFESCGSEWSKVVRQLAQKEQKKMEELVIKIDNKKSEEETELNKLKQDQNATTEANLSDVLPEKTILRIKESRERQSKSKVRHDTEQSLKEGSVLIKRAAEMERVISNDGNYSKVLLKQYEILTNINEKYKRKFDRLFLKNFPKVKTV